MPYPLNAADTATALDATALALILLWVCAAVPVGHRAVGERATWGIASALALLLVLLAALIGLFACVFGAQTGTLGLLLPSLRLDGLTAVMLALVGFITWVIIRFSQHYLEGDPRRMRYLGWLNLTIAAITLLVVTNNLLMLAMGWATASLSLHQLLTFYDERRGAMLAAHKKFLLSRAADLAMFGAVFLIGRELGTLEIDAIGQLLVAMPKLDAGLSCAALLLAFAAILKCAQLPFHGWLIQVMEAPTPVSALLHAGIVNVGGFVMIRLSALMAQAEAAQLLLVLFGGLTALLAALVMTTRVSIKVSLAWSTCAQMGFMLMECGLGAYPLALLHLVGHSLYKAHAFLSSGSVVGSFRSRQLAPTKGPQSLGRWLLAHVLYLPAAAGLAWMIGPASFGQAANAILYGVLFLALCVFFAEALYTRSLLTQALAGAAAWVLAGAYIAFHLAIGSLFELPTITHWPAAVAAGFFMTALYAAFSTIHLAPTGAFSRWLYPRAFAGFHLDEAFTRISLHLWPARLPKHRSHGVSALSLKTTEVLP